MVLLNRIKTLSFLLILVSLVSCKFENKTHLESPIIPRPRTMFPATSSFVITEKTKIIIDNNSSEMKNMADILKQLIDSTASINISIQDISQSKDLNNIILLTTTNTPERVKSEGYHLKVDKDKLVIQGQENSGVFNGLMSLSQIILLNEEDQKLHQLEIPNIQIWDEPRFMYRGMHLDVARHFFPVSFIKKYLRIMALYKFNYFHWHLTEDQAWRLEIKAFPKLTETGAWRTEENGEKYGGFYSQEEIKEVVAYAKSLNITIIPEIELPGHSRAAIAAYPHLSCTKKQLQVPNTWGVFEDVYCAGNEETFSFMEKVMDEVMALFPGQYIHIGGDECPKTRWQECSKCQQKIKEEGLENEEELQSYFIKRVERYLNAHGRQIIGWDEILEGGLAPEATVMSWRGEQGGIQAAQQEHQVIMTPNSHCYFDHYQADPAFEPKAIGGFTPLNKVYNYEPIPTDLSEEQAKYIWGAQGNMWTEYMPNSSQVEYMLLPRMIALSEVLWSRKEYKDYLDFNKRLQSHKNLLQKLGYQYSKGSYKINLLTKYDTTNHTYKAEFVNEQHQAIIRYTLDNTMPNDSSLQFDSAFIIKHSCLITAAIFEQGELMRSPSKFQYEHHIGVGKQIELLKKPSLEYGGKVETILLDGLQGSSNSYKDSWLAFKGKDLLAKIDLKQKYPLNQLSFSFINKPDHNILAPISATIFTSEDGERFLEYKYEEIAGNTQQLDTIMGKFVIALPSDSIRYLKIRIENAEVTDTHNNGAWLLIDELVIK